MTRLNMSSDMYAPTLDDVADAFGFPAKRPPSEPCYGMVAAVNADGSYQVRLNASSVTTRCANCCTAAVGDRVLVANMDGKCAAIGRVGGEPLPAPADLGMADHVVAQGTSGGWYYEKRASGFAEVWNMWMFPVTSVSGWGSLYGSANALSPGPWPFEFVGIPYVWHCLDGSGNGDYQMGGYTTQANFQTATTAPNLWVITPNSGTYNRGGYVVMQARGRWK